MREPAAHFHHLLITYSARAEAWGRLKDPEYLSGFTGMFPGITATGEWDSSGRASTQNTTRSTGRTVRRRITGCQDLKRKRAMSAGFLVFSLRLFHLRDDGAKGWQRYLVEVDFGRDFRRLISFLYQLSIEFGSADSA